MPNKTQKRNSSGKRELISPRGDKRYAKRNAKGQFAEMDDQKKSLSRDIKRNSLTLSRKNVVKFAPISHWRPSDGSSSAQMLGTTSFAASSSVGSESPTITSRWFKLPALSSPSMRPLRDALKSTSCRGPF